MKKTLNLLSLLLIIAFFTTSCKKNEKISADYVDIGSSHNNTLVLYASNSNNIALDKISFSHDEIRERIIQTLIAEDPMKYKEKDVRNSFKELDQLNILPQTKGKSSQADNMSLILEFLKKSGKISENLAIELEKIHSLSLKGISSKEIFKSLDKLKQADFTETDQKYLNAFSDVYKSSYLFWTNKVYSKSRKNLGFTTNLVDPANLCNQAIILADAAGALYGMITGPITSVLEAAVFSLIASINPPCHKEGDPY